MAKPKTHKSVFICPACNKETSMSHGVPRELISHSINEWIQKFYPELTTAEFICIACLERFRTAYIHHIIEEEKQELDSLQMDVAKSLEKESTLAQNINIEFEKKLTVGEKAADKIAEFGGSWQFIGFFMFFMIGWMIFNTIALFWQPFDPFPFILLNLMLSALAAIQAPIIMMSQNRQEAKDRIRSEHDYRINLKAELEIRHLHAKMDMLLTNQWQRLLEIQQIQMEMMEDLARSKK